MTVTSAIDPADRAQVVRALEAYLVEHIAPTVSLAVPPAPLGQGFDTFIYTFRAGAPSLPPGWDRDLVLRVYGSPEQSAKCEREAAVQRFAAGLGFPAVEPLAAEATASSFGLPIMVMPRISGGTLLDAVTARPWQARRVLREMGRLHAALHALPADGAPLPNDEPLVARVLAEARGRMDVPGMAAHAPDMEDGYRWLLERQPALSDQERVLCHNDYHPLNILLDGDGRMHVIDWSNAALGDRHCDAGRTIGLFWFAQIVASSAVEKLLLRGLRGFLRRNYLHGYRKVAPLDEKRLALWETVHTFGGWMQLAELAARRDAGESATAMAEGIPPTMIATARERFWKLAGDVG